jgi:Zn-dependent alcohol dehydrogenase
VLEKVDAPFILRDVILDTVRDDEVLVEIKYTGLCHTVRSSRDFFTSVS